MGQRVTALGVAIALLACALRVEAKLPGPPAVIVQDFGNRSYEIRYDWVGIGLAYLVRKNLSLLAALEMLEDRRARPGDEEPIADFVIDGEVRLDELDRSGEKFVVFVTLDRLGATAIRRQFLTEGDVSQLFDMAEYLTERIARHLEVDIGAQTRARFGRGMTDDLNAFQQFAEAIIDRRTHSKLEAYERATLIDPGFAEAYFHLGRVHTVLGQYDEAEGFLRQAIALIPDFADAHNDLAYILVQQGRIEAAESEYRAAVTADGSEPKYRLNLGDVLRHRGRCSESEKAYRAALELRPGHLEAIEGLQALRVACGDRVAQVIPSSAPRLTPRASPAPTPGSTPRPRTPPRPTPTPRPPVRPQPTPTPVAVASQPTPQPAPPVTGLVKRGRVGDKEQRELELARRALARPRGDAAAARSAFAAAEAAFAAGDQAGVYLALSRFYSGEKSRYAALEAIENAAEIDPTDGAIKSALAEIEEQLGRRRGK